MIAAVFDVLRCVIVFLIMVMVLRMLILKTLCYLLIVLGGLFSVDAFEIMMLMLFRCFFVSRI